MRLWTVALLVLVACQEPRARDDLRVVSGDPRYSGITVHHDTMRGVTCYAAYHGGLDCFLDITLEDQQRMLVYRDGGQ